MKLKNLIANLFRSKPRHGYRMCKCADIPFKEYPTRNEGKLIQLHSGEWVSTSSLPYIAPERFKCRH